MAYGKGWIRDKYKYSPVSDARKWGEKPICAMRCCNKDWCEANGVTRSEALHFKRLADDLLGIMYWAGYLPTDFRSILHVLATFSSPDVLKLYDEAKKLSEHDKGMFALLKERAILTRELREANGDIIIPSDKRPEIRYRKLVHDSPTSWEFVKSSPINIEIAVPAKDNGKEANS